MADNMNDRVVHNGDPVKLEAIDAINPWMVDNVSVFLNYCCPECDFKAKNLKLFSIHALKNHEEALVLFEEVLSDIEVKNNNSDTYKVDQMDIKSENEEIGFRIDLKSHEKQADQVSDKSRMPGESRVLLDNRIISTSSKKQISRSCEEVLSDIEAKNDNSDTYKEDRMDSNSENEEIGLRIDLKSHEKQTGQVFDKSGMREHWVLLAPEQFGRTPLSGDRRGNMPPLLKKSGMPGESRVLQENRIMSTSSRKRISQSCCVKTCMSTNLDKIKKNFYSIPSPNRYRHSICITTVRCELALVHLIPSWLNCAEIECTVHFALVKQPIKIFKQVQ